MDSQISIDLEHCLMHAAMAGHIPISTLKENELSKEGRWSLAALRYLSKKKEPPFSAKTLFVTASDVLGGDRDLLKPYCVKVRDAGSGMEAADLLHAIRRKQTLVNVINAAGEQLSKGGELDTHAIMSLLDRESAANNLKSLSSYVTGKLPPLPRGVEIRSLPKLDKASGGLFGLWAIGGQAGVGKSSLAIQLALEYAREHDVLYYDMEQGELPILSHLGVAFDGDVKKVKRLTERLYIREGVRTLNDDLMVIKPPSMIVFDSIQSVPTSADNRRSSLDVWIVRCNTLKRRGYTVLIVSELNRDNYGKATQKGFKETGSIEYKADFGIQLLGIGESGDAEVHCVKNRHREFKGHLHDIYRRNGWLFSETLQRRR